MKLLQELLALKEAHHNEHSEVFKDLDYWIDGTHGLESADVEVFYEYEGADYTDHPYGSTTAREHYPASVGILAVELLKDSSVYDEDGDKVIEVMKKGTDLLQQPWWKGEWTDHLEEEIHERIGKMEPDFNEPDDYDDPRDWG